MRWIVGFFITVYSYEIIHHNGKPLPRSQPAKHGGNGSAVAVWPWKLFCTQVVGGGAAAACLLSNAQASHDDGVAMHVPIF